jgi:predicted TIM-barrel fold metal-dependent hydrolase
VVKAKAVVDLLRESATKGENLYRVEAWGESPHDFVRIYTVDAKSDTLAAQEGIRRFVEEMENRVLQVRN